MKEAGTMLRLTRNILWNLVGQSLPLLVGLAAIPITVRYLGDARFGLLGLVWAILGYFSVFDFGLGRATTKFVAEMLGTEGEGEPAELSVLVAGSVVAQTSLGVIGGATLWFATSLLVSDVFRIDVAFRAEAVSTFHVLAALLPVLLFTLSLRAILEGAQRFDLVNLIRVPNSILVFVIPAVGASLGMRLPVIVMLLLVARVVIGVLTLLAVHKALPSFVWRVGRDWGLLVRLVSYGGWVAVSNFLSPFLVFLDRFAVGSLVGLSAVAYYTAPYEVVTRLWIIPASVASALFPALSANSRDGSTGEDAGLYVGSIRHVILLMLVPTALLVAFAGDLLRLWLGPTFAESGAVALRFLAIGVFINSIAHIPYSYLQAHGRPDLTAKFHLLELPIHLVVVWYLVSRFGVPGAAMAWTVRVALDAGLLLGGVRWKFRIPLADTLRGIGASALTTCGVFVVALGAVRLSPLPDRWQILLTVGLIFSVGFTVWQFVLTSEERRVAAAVIDRRTQSVGNGR